MLVVAVPIYFLSLLLLLSAFFFPGQQWQPTHQEAQKVI
jgi:hypothetical protein